MQPSSMTGSSKILGRHGLELVEGEETGREEKKGAKEERKAATGLCRHFCQLAAPYQLNYFWFCDHRVFPCLGGIQGQFAVRRS